MSTASYYYSASGVRYACTLPECIYKNTTAAMRCAICQSGETIILCPYYKKVEQDRRMGEITVYYHNEETRRRIIEKIKELLKEGVTVCWTERKE